MKWLRILAATAILIAIAAWTAWRLFPVQILVVAREQMTTERTKLVNSLTALLRIIDLAFLGSQNCDVDLEFSGGIFQARVVDVAAHVQVDRPERGA